MWQAEKHIANSSILTVLLKIQTNKPKEKKKGMFSDVELA